MGNYTVVGIDHSILKFDCEGMDTREFVLSGGVPNKGGGDAPIIEEEGSIPCDFWAGCIQRKFDWR
jgi:hypothetical protein